jgi:hypothetical protein
MKMPFWVVEVFWLTFFALCVSGGTTLPFFVGDPEPTKIKAVPARFESTGFTKR